LGVQLSHVVRPELLTAAQSEVRAAMQSGPAADVVLCTCTTLAPMVEDHPRHLAVTTGAIDRVVGVGGRVFVFGYRPQAINLVQQLLKQASELAGVDMRVQSYECPKAVAHLETKDLSAAAKAIAQQVRQAVAKDGPPDSILLAQASMRCALPELGDVDCPVIATPDSAVQAAVERARA